MVWEDSTVNADLNVVMEILRKHSSKDRPLSTREIKEMSSGRLQGHANVITPMLNYQARISTIVQLPYVKQRDGYRYHLPKQVGVISA